LNKTKIYNFIWIALLIFFWVVSENASAQTRSFWDSVRTENQKEEPIEKGNPEITGYINAALDKKLDSLADIKRKATRIDGFRIQLYSGNDRQKAIKAKEMAYRLIKKTDVYTTYKSPTFTVRMGDFYQKSDAFMVLKKLESGFPNAVIVSEIVNLKP
jgi:hypothetical protein